VVLCLEMTLVSWLLARDGYGEHTSLRGLGRQSVTPYVHGKRELYCSSLTSPVSAFFLVCHLPWPLIDRACSSYNVTQAPTGSPEVI
jgi:hypothetical protein